MIISRNLLSEFYPGIKDLTLEQISDAFFKIGIEIEGFERIVEPSGLYYGIVRSFGKIEGSDKLNLCKVFVPVKDQTFEIVCGASNVREGMGVVVALPGAKLSNGQIEITERKFEEWGIISYGMLCSYTELYHNPLLKDIYSFEKGRIIELSDKWDLNREFKSVDLWLDDWVFDLFIPANRGDLHSAWGLSRELAKILGVSKRDLTHGGRYSKDQDIWMIKRALLTNNHKGIGEDSFESYLEGYLYLAFNEYFESQKETRKKSDYFKKLRDGFVSGKAAEDFAMRKIEISRQKILSFLGLPTDWKYRGDFFILEDEYAEVPEWRSDILTERDVSDEIISFIGWDKVRFDPIPTNIGGTNKNSLIMAVEKIREFWRNMGFYECTTFNLHEKTEGEITLNNPLSSEHVSLRTHAINELVDVLKENHCFKRDLYPLFEIFESQTPEPTWTLNIVVPEVSLAFPLSGTQLFFDLCDLQSLMRKCFRYLNLDLHFSPWDDKSQSLPFIGSKCRLSIKDGSGRKIGKMGYLSPIDSIRLWGCYCILEFLPPKRYVSSVPSKYPSVYKDISIAVEKTKGITLQTITASLNSDHFISWRLLEKYEKEGALSYLLRIRLQSFEETLTGAKIQKNMDQIISCISSIEGVEIR